MGYDAIALIYDYEKKQLPEGVKFPENIMVRFEKIGLMRGLVCGMYPNAFRGGRYQQLIRAVTGIDLIRVGDDDNLITDRKLLETIYEKLKAKFGEIEMPTENNFEKTSEDFDFFSEDISKTEKQHLVLFFRLVLEHNLVIWNYY